MLPTDRRGIKSKSNVDCIKKPSTKTGHPHPNHSTVSRTRRRIDVDTHGEVFTWVLKQLAQAGLVRGKTIGKGSGPAQLEGEEPEVPGASVRESETDSGPPGTKVAAAAERVGGAVVCARVHHGWVAPHIRPGSRQCPEATADPSVWFQPGTTDAPSDGDRYTPELQSCVLVRPFSVFGATMGRWLGWNRLWERFGAPIGLDSPFGAPRNHQ